MNTMVIHEVTYKVMGFEYSDIVNADNLESFCRNLEQCHFEITRVEFNI